MGFSKESCTSIIIVTIRKVQEVLHFTSSPPTKQNAKCYLLLQFTRRREEEHKQQYMEKKKNPCTLTLIVLLVVKHPLLSEKSSSWLKRS